MPRHTHPRPRAKHARAHIRAARQAAIDRRFAAAKNDGTLDHVHLSARGYSQDAAHLAAEAELAALLDRLGFAYDPDRPAYQQGPVHPDVLRHIPPGLARRLHAGFTLGAGAAIGQLADRDAFWRYRCDCSACHPERQPGYRRQAKNRFEADVHAQLGELDANGRDELLGGRRDGAVTDRRKQGWC